MNALTVRQKITKFVVILLVAGQLAFSFNFLLIPPKKAEAAILGIDFSVVIGDIPEKIIRIAQGAMVRMAQNYANQYLTRFVNKVVDKYKIRDFLYYDKYLSDYYLSNLILDNISDPDLRQAFDLMYRATVSGRTQGYTGVDPKAAILPQIKQKIAEYYVKSGGIDPSKVYSPPANMSDKEYFAMAQAYFSNPPSFTEQNLRGQFGSFQSAATTASQLEISLGGGSKAGRVLTGTCQNATNAKDPVACANAGGTWQRGALDTARDFIDNPAGQVNNYVISAINRLFDNNYDPSNIWTAIGSALGNFAFNKLNLSSVDGTFKEYDYLYQGDSGDRSNLTEVDLDKDGIPDGQDGNEDGQLSSLLDTCYHGGIANVAPGCTRSSQATGSPYFTPFCENLEKAITNIDRFARFIDDHADDMQGGASLRGQIIGTILTGGLGGFLLGGFFGSGSVDNFKNEADAGVWLDRSQRLSGDISELVDSIRNFHNTKFDSAEITINRYSAFLDKINESLSKDQDMDLAKFGSGGGGLANLMKHTENTRKYLIDLKEVVGQCENPNDDAVANLGTPTVDVGFGDELGPCTLSLDITNEVTAEPPTTNPDGSSTGSATGSSTGAVSLDCPGVDPDDLIPQPGTPGNPGNPGTPGTGSCAGTDIFARWRPSLLTAMQHIINTNPNGIADKPNTEANGREFLQAVADLLISTGLRASTGVLNGNNNPNTGDLIAIWRDGDTLAERYDAIVNSGAGDRPMRDATQATFVGGVPISSCIP